MALWAAGRIGPLIGGEGLGRRVEQEPHQRPECYGVGRGDLHIEADRRGGAHQVADREVGDRQCAFDVLAGQPFEIGPRRALDRGPEAVVHRRITRDRGPHEGMRLRLAVRAWAMQRLQHEVGRVVEVGQQLPHLDQRLVRVICGVEDVQDHRLEDLGGGLVPDGLVVAVPPGIGEDRHQALDLGEFAGPGPDLGQRVPAG